MLYSIEQIILVGTQALLFTLSARNIQKGTYIFIK